MAKFISKSNNPIRATIKNGKSGSLDLNIMPGKECELPEENGFVKSLVAQGKIEAVTVETAKAPKANKNTDKTSENER